jgi:hypothetical protein
MDCTVAQAVDLLLSMCKALSSNLTLAKKKKVVDLSDC